MSKKIFLLYNLKDDALLKYNINKKLLEEDILNRRISTLPYNYQKDIINNLIHNVNCNNFEKAVNLFKIDLSKKF